MRGVTGDFLNRGIRVLGLGLSAALFCCVSLAQAQEPLSYTRIYTDADGESHFEDVPVDFDQIELPSGEHASVARYAVDGPAMVLVLEPGTFEDWHPGPADPQLCVVVQGFVEVQVSDGEMRTFGPGDMFIMEDNHGKGHTTRAVGDVPHALMMMPLIRE